MMRDVNVIAILVATVVTFVLGGFYYAILGKQLPPSARLQRRPADP